MTYCSTFKELTLHHFNKNPILNNGILKDFYNSGSLLGSFVIVEVFDTKNIYMLEEVNKINKRNTHDMVVFFVSGIGVDEGGFTTINLSYFSKNSDFYDTLYDVPIQHLHINICIFDCVSFEKYSLLMSKFTSLKQYIKGGHFI